MISENEKPLITKKVILIIIGCIATILTFITMIMPFTESKADSLSPAYKAVTIYCVQNNCRNDKQGDSKLENTLNKIRQDTPNFQRVVSVMPVVGQINDFITERSDYPRTSGYTIVIEYLK